MSNVAKLKKKAAELEAKKDFGKALAVYVELLDNYDKNAAELDVSLFNRVGDLMLRQGSVADALDYYERAVDKYVDGGFYNNAIALCNKILRQSPGRASIYYKLGKISAHKGFTTDAKQNFLEYADRMQKAGNMNEAFRALTEFADLCPGQDDIRLMLADQLSKLNRKEEAIEQLQILWQRYSSEGRQAEAAATLQRMKGIDPAAEPRESSGKRQARGGDLVFLDLNDAPAARPKSPTPAASMRRPASNRPPPPKEVADLPLLDSGFGEDEQTPAPQSAPPPVSPPPTRPRAAEPPHAKRREPAPPAPPPAHPEPPLQAAAGTLEGMEPTSVAPDAAESAPLPDTIDFQPTSFDDSSFGSSGIDDGRGGSLPDSVMLEPVAPDPSLLGSMDVGSSNGYSPFDSLGHDPLGLESPPRDLSTLDLDAPTQSPFQDWGNGMASDVAGEMGGEGVNHGFLNDAIDFGESPSSEGAGAAPSDALVDFDISDIDSAPPMSGGPHAIGRSTQFAERSVEALRAAVDNDPGNWELHREMAEAMLESGDREGGIHELEATMTGAERANDLDLASSIAEEIARLSPDTVRYHQKRVEYAFRTNDKLRLIEAYLALAGALQSSEQFEKARAVYERVLDLAPDDIRAQTALESLPASAPAAEDEQPGSTARPAARASGARAAAPRTRTAAEPAISEDGFINLGDMLRDDAPRSTRMVVDEEEPTGDEEADFADMLKKFKQGIAENVDQEDYQSHYDLGVAFKEMGLVDEAVAEFQKALRAPSNRVPTFEALGQCFIEKEQYAMAATVLARALNETGHTDDQLVGVLYLLGRAAEALNRYEEALTYYQRVFVVDIEFRDIADRIAELERAVG
ncbi:MAG TPA: tetratricopeptide repeat protein [Gemmatimonadaceae bacterium]|nr:tetratricopeptide repeat protein [Gemmatimonadaceae bacterium]